MTEAEQALLAELELHLETFSHSDPYAAFGLWEGCGREQVERAFQRLKSVHKPGRYANFGSKPISTQAVLVYAGLLDAYEHLCSLEQTSAPLRPRPSPDTNGNSGPTALARTLEQLVKAERATSRNEPSPNVARPHGGRPPRSRRRGEPPRAGESPAIQTGGRAKGAEVAGIPAIRRLDLAQTNRSATSDGIEPAILFTAGMADLARDAFAEANIAFEAAARATPDSGTYAVYAAWTRYLCTPEAVEEVSLRLKTALVKDGGREPGAYYLGIVALNEGRLERAIRWLDIAIEANPENTDAKRARALVHIRAAHSSNSSG